jgi:hypothetical protein
MLLLFDHPPSTSAKQELLAARVTVWQKAECQVRRKRQEGQRQREIEIKTRKLKNEGRD